MSAEPSLRERIAGLRLLEDPEARAEGLLVCFSDRHGGVSSSPYDSLNLAATVGDAPEAVAHNRARVASEAGFDLADLALTRQVHGSSIHEVEREAAGVLGEADGLVVRERGSI
ncbi:MAG TPA: laccase domain-containing protein, partial [Actinomycetota bacterium]|nr:laccase domain-containing protein [Actinomycetota bacterium]